jgi:hypothetical protein
MKRELGGGAEEQAAGKKARVSEKGWDVMYGPNGSAIFPESPEDKTNRQDNIEGIVAQIDQRWNFTASEHREHLFDLIITAMNFKKPKYSGILEEIASKMPPNVKEKYTSEGFRCWFIKHKMGDMLKIASVESAQHVLDKAGGPIRTINPVLFECETVLMKEEGGEGPAGRRRKLPGLLLFDPSQASGTSVVPLGQLGFPSLLGPAAAVAARSGGASSTGTDPLDEPSSAGTDESSVSCSSSSPS